MEEIKVGEYIRTSYDGIAKVVEVTENYCRKEDGFKVWFHIDKEIKHSKNIIDLIEVGDYVNGYPVIDIGQDYICVCDYGKSEDLIEEDIKSIVTKEQFESMEYKVGG